MPRRIRFTTGSILWAILLFAVCFSWFYWFVERTRRQWIEEAQWELFQKRGKQLEYARQVNEELRHEVKALRAKLRANGMDP